MSRSIVPLCVGLAVSLVWLAAGVPAPAQGTIRYVPEVSLNYQFGDTPWDVDGDGVAEFYFEFDRYSCGLIVLGGSHVLTFAVTPPYIPYVGGQLSPLFSPTEIGREAQDSLQWVGSENPAGFRNRANINFYSSNGYGGTFYGVRAYFGFNFELEGETHYGWGLFNASAGPGGYLEAYAYNLTPGAPIFVGQVPEPATWVLLAGGMLVFAVAGRRRRLSGHSG